MLWLAQYVVYGGRKMEKKNLTGDSSQMKAICLCGAIG